jgi:hypothetical protein
MSCPTSTDTIIYVLLCKLDIAMRTAKMSLNIPLSRALVKSIHNIAAEDRTSSILHTGSLGILRASHRAADREKSMHEQFPFHPHEKMELIPEGKAVELEIGI